MEVTCELNLDNINTKKAMEDLCQAASSISLKSNHVLSLMPPPHATSQSNLSQIVTFTMPSSESSISFSLKSMSISDGNMPTNKPPK